MYIRNRCPGGPFGAPPRAGQPPLRRTPGCWLWGVSSGSQCSQARQAGQGPGLASKLTNGWPSPHPRRREATGTDSHPLGSVVMPCFPPSHGPCSTPALLAKTIGTGCTTVVWICWGLRVRNAQSRHWPLAGRAGLHLPPASCRRCDRALESRQVVNRIVNGRAFGAGSGQSTTSQRHSRADVELGRSGGSGVLAADWPHSPAAQCQQAEFVPPPWNRHQGCMAWRWREGGQVSGPSRYLDDLSCSSQQTQ